MMRVFAWSLLAVVAGLALSLGGFEARAADSVDILSFNFERAMPGSAGVTVDMASARAPALNFIASCR
jgi:hypothetical protein